MAVRQNETLNIEDINVKVGIAYGIALIVLILIYWVFFR